MQVKDQITVGDVHRTIVRKLDNFVPRKYTTLLATPYGRTTYVKANFSSWQYNGCAEFEAILLWCEKTFGDDWIWNFETIYFKYDKDRTVFLMRWA
jgi:hypothetical protein